MQGKTCVITGATSGVGQGAAFTLAALGARIVFVARDKDRARATLARLAEISPGVAHRAHHADLSQLADMKRVAAEIAAAEPRVDVLINNAGALFAFRGVTEDGFERTFALNHLAYFVLTLGLRERLFAAVPARVVSTTSAMHKRATLKLDDLQCERDYNGVDAYERSKLCNVLFTRELARRWAGHGVTANCLHPGLVATRIGNQSGGVIPLVLGFMKLVLAEPVETGAQRIVQLAASPEVADVTGGYFEKMRQVPPGRNADDEEAARKLWEASAQLTGMK
jgi:retinol dehydrogenase 12